MSWFLIKKVFVNSLLTKQIPNCILGCTKNVPGQSRKFTENPPLLTVYMVLPNGRPNYDAATFIHIGDKKGIVDEF